jgi:hypothetical protein
MTGNRSNECTAVARLRGILHRIMPGGIDGKPFSVAKSAANVRVLRTTVLRRLD